MIRNPVVAGQFYPDSPSLLNHYLERYIPKGVPKEAALGAVVPHAGYMFSGGVAGAVYAKLDIPDTIIILGPNHTGIGAAFALMDKGIWKTPLGNVPINETLAQLILSETDLLTSDLAAHQYEHSIEVQLPFLQYLKNDFSFVPITLTHTWYSNCELLGEVIARAIKKFGEPVLIIASSDMTHYEPHEKAKAKDSLAVNRILALDPGGLYETVHTQKITMCGVIPTAVMLQVTKLLGAKEAELIAYATSGDISGDYGSVVGYAGIIVK
ncbi:MAG: AmmeMemoRadiSam system protein B [Candidatus Desulfofervidaceae bacterium]|nr:AmmeMemoRadiSam system protein B [Candidatus Desulfofervidaceae bacterium]MDL1969616.1 AmmeMemoRadiSam system protein B [Candidatus Desulfofervidaceae bacterium]